uniref:Uncharacterized protein n=1 Tax=Anguilla anguilla TaxID=7936 RepID=A0A0E9RNS0_ANGAN
MMSAVDLVGIYSCVSPISNNIHCKNYTKVT